MKKIPIALALLAVGGGAAYVALGRRAVEPERPKAAPLDPRIRLGGVDAVAKDPGAFAGRIAIEGIVGKTFPERGAFTMIDLAEWKACGDADCTGCSEYTVPVLVPKAEFEGEVPKSPEQVVAVGVLSVEGKGFRFVVDEVRRGESIVLKRVKPAADTGTVAPAPVTSVSTSRLADSSEGGAVAVFAVPGMT